VIWKKNIAQSHLLESCLTQPASSIVLLRPCTNSRLCSRLF